MGKGEQQISPDTALLPISPFPCVPVSHRTAPSFPIGLNECDSESCMYVSPQRALLLSGSRVPLEKQRKAQVSYWILTAAWRRHSLSPWNTETHVSDLVHGWSWSYILQLLEGRNIAILTELWGTEYGKLECVFIPIWSCFRSMVFEVVVQSHTVFQWIFCSSIHLLVAPSQWFSHTVNQKRFPASELACLIMVCCEIARLFWLLR